MVKPRLSDSFACDQCAGDGSGDPIADYLETIGLLQEEVSRLEQELRSRDECRSETAPDAEASVEPAAHAQAIAGASEEVERLKAELSSREETIGLLLDELSRLEAAQAAAGAEWEHLAGWVAELEQRVEEQDGGAPNQLEDRFAAQQQLESLRLKSEKDRRAWEAQRQIDQAEIARLQATLDQVTTSPEASGDHGSRLERGCGPDADRIEALQAENLRLRAAWQELVERTATDRSESSDAKLAESLEERHRLQHELEKMQDERNRERLEHEATLAELQSRLARALVARAPGPAPEERPDGVSHQTDAELRIRALRQHLLEIDEREKEERKQKRLTARLSRLWSRTGPR